MIRVGIYSQDRSLQPLLSSALGDRFTVSLDSREDGIQRMLAAGDCDVMVLDLNAKNLDAKNLDDKDLDARRDLLKQRIVLCRQVIDSRFPAVIMADDSLRSMALELVRLGAFGYCRRPPSIRDLKAILLRAHEHSTLKRELQTVQQQLEAANSCDRLIGSSPQMRRVYDLVRRVTDINASVLITGESGTGKELIASAIHKLGARKDKPFVAVSCGAIPETLIEAELFGHEKGAFTGSVASRVGYLEQAGDGTLLLDEIGELSLATQVKLLRVLQQREFSRLGCNKLIPQRARVIFATHQDLTEMVAQGKFRQDLYYRINVMRIEAPPLREHLDDLPQIATHFLRQYSEMYGKPMIGMDSAVLPLLQDYGWPGNVRELENVIQRAIIMARGNTITADCLPPHIQDVHDDGVVKIDEFQAAGSFERQIRIFKVQLAVAAVREHNGNKTLAARSLQISRAYLHRLIRVAEPDLAPDLELESA